MQFFLRGSITFVIILTLSIVLSGQQFNMQRRMALLPHWSPWLRPIFNIYQPHEDPRLMHEYPNIELGSHLQDNQRLLLASSTFANPFFRIITFTVVSTVNITEIQSCIPSNLFVPASINVFCRRKRRGIDIHEAPEDNFQFPVNPSKPQRLLTTDVASIEQLTEENRQFPTTIASSKDEAASNEISSAREQVGKSKRFLKYFGSTTVYSYTLATIMATRTITPITFVQQLLCRPSGYAVC